MMEKYYSKKVEVIKSSPLVALVDKGKKMEDDGIDVLSFAGGEPDFDTPDMINWTAINSLTKGDTHYVASAGLPALRQRIAKKLLEENQIDVDWKTQIIVTPGGKTALFLALSAILDPMDEVFIFEPAWVSYRQLINWNGAVPVSVPLDYEDNYHITREKLEKYYTPKTKAMVLNSPNNPTGRVLAQDEIDAIADFVEEHKVLVIADEIYEKIIYDGKKNTSLGSVERIKEYVVTVNGLSKGYAMTGWRVGYVAAHPDLIKQMLKIVSNVYTCVPSFVQTASVKAFDCEDDVERMRVEYEKRRNYIVNALNEMPGVSCRMPEGAFYIMPKIEKDGLDSWGIADLILEKCNVVVAPGDVFGAGGENCIRMSYATSMENLGDAVERLKTLFK